MTPPNDDPGTAVGPALPGDAASTEGAEESRATAAEARRWLLEATSATLCTLSAHPEVKGYPFGSIVPFALDAEGRPFILIAHIAQHTKNLLADPRASLFVHEPGRTGDPQAGWRGTLLGRFERVDDDKGEDPARREELEDLEARYLERVPTATRYFETHGFAYWRLHVEKVRYIAGFGRITWLGGASVRRDPLGAGLREAGPGAVAHMNADHRENLREMARAFYGIDPASIELIGVERTGFMARTTGPDRRLWFPFGREVDAAGLRQAAVDLVKRARLTAAGA